MDVLCSKCGEPWDHDSLHEEASARRELAQEQGDLDSSSYDATFKAVGADFRANGCVAFRTAFGTGDCTRTASVLRPHRAVVAAAAYELLGDDMDGAAAMFEDLRL